MVQVNDIVRFLNDVGGGKVTRVEGNMAYVEDRDGFERPTLVANLVVVDTAKPHHSTYEKPFQVRPTFVEPERPAPAPKPEPEVKLPVIEVPDNDRLNVVLAYEPRRLKNLNSTTFFATLVNDSNYFVAYVYMTRGDDGQDWHTRATGVVEPNVQVPLEEFSHADLNAMTHIAVQLMAYKKDRPFALKDPVLVTRRLDVTKFHKLHCFKENEYFDYPVMAIDIVRNDVTTRPLHVDAAELENAMRERRHDRPRDEHRSIAHRDTKKQHRDIVVQDLHIAELLDDLSGLSKGDMLNYQLDKFREVMNEHRNYAGQKLVFIHGKGEGVLRRAILDELTRKWPWCEVQDASFREYGFGATQVTIRRPKD